MRFNGDENEININTAKPEFFEWKWININDLTKVVVHFKLEVYRRVQSHLENLTDVNL